MSMNVTGIDLTVGQRLEVRIVDEVAEAKIKADNDQYLRQLIQELIDEELNVDDEEDDPFDELYSASDWNFETPINISKMIYEKPEYIYRNLYKSDLSYGLDTYDDDDYGDPGYEYRKLIAKWKATDPLRWQLIQEHDNRPSDQIWNSDHLKVGDRVQLLWFLDETPGYAYMKGQTGTVISKNSKRALNYIIVHFDGMENQVQVIPGILKRISGDNLLPKLIDIDLIRTDRLGDGWTAWVEGFRGTWEYSDLSKNDAIHKMLQTWYWNLKNR